MSVETSVRSLSEENPSATLGSTLLFETLLSEEEQAALYSEQQVLSEEAQDSRSITLGQSHFTSSQTEFNSPRYTFAKQLGEGAYGRVWKATDTDIGRDVAIKSYKVKGPNGQRLCTAEIAIAGQLDHPGVPAVYDISKEEDQSYHVVMKYLEGESLEEIIEQLKAGSVEAHEKYSFETRVELMIQLLRILASAHQSGIVHRDIKPENILIGTNGEAYLMDWGIAINLATENGEGQLAGTPYYMSPEQALSLAVDHRSDLYAITAVFFELMSLTRAAPDGANAEEILLKLQEYELTETQIWRKHPIQGYYPIGYRPFIRRGLQKDLSERYQSAEEMLQHLHDIQSGKISMNCPISMVAFVIQFLNRGITRYPLQVTSIVFMGLLSTLGALVFMVV